MHRRETTEVLKHACQAFAEDWDFVLAAIRHNAHVLRYASEALTKSKDFILAAVTTGGYTLCHVPEVWLLDKDVVLAGLSAQSCAIKKYRRQMGQRQQIHKEFIVRLVQTTGNAMQYLDKTWYADADVYHAYTSSTAEDIPIQLIFPARGFPGI